MQLNFIVTLFLQGTCKNKNQHRSCKQFSNKQPLMYSVDQIIYNYWKPYFCFYVPVAYMLQPCLRAFDSGSHWLVITNLLGPHKKIKKNKKKTPTYSSSSWWGHTKWTIASLVSKVRFTRLFAFLNIEITFYVVVVFEIYSAFKRL